MICPSRLHGGQEQRAHTDTQEEKNQFELHYGHDSFVYDSITNFRSRTSVCGPPSLLVITNHGLDFGHDLLRNLLHAMQSAGITLGKARFWNNCHCLYQNTHWCQ
jgi:hypothetical protein